MYLKILWFSLIQPDSVRKKLGYQSLTGQTGWVENLLRAIKKLPEVELSIATYSPTKFKSFTYDNVKYYCIHWQTPESKIGSLVYSWKHHTEPADLMEKMESILEDCQPDIIHVHGTESSFGKVKNITNIPVVISLQGILYGYLAFAFTGISMLNIFRQTITVQFLRGTGLIHGYWRMRKMIGREIRIVRDNRFFIGRTHWDKDLLSIINSLAVYCHCDEIMRPCFYDGNWNCMEAKDNTIYSTSSAMTWKGTEILLEAISIMHSSGMTNISLRIAGVHVKQEYGKILTRKCNKLGIGDSITWLGRLSAEEIKREILNASIFVYPSHIDNSPNALVEAMLLGAPCIASYAGGIPSLLQNDEEGLLYQDSDPYALAGRIRTLLINREFAQQLGINARHRAHKRNEPNAIAINTIKIYTRILESVSETCSK